MNKDEIVKIIESNYDRFILLGTLAIETFNDINNEFKIKYNECCKKVSEYRNNTNKTIADKKTISNEILATMECMGLDYFIFYNDGEVNCDVSKLRK